MLIFIYLVGCLVVAMMARDSHIGFWGFFFLSILITPIITLAVIVITAQRKFPKRRFAREAEKFAREAEKAGFKRCVPGRDDKKK